MSWYFTYHLSLTRIISRLPFACSSSSSITRIFISVVHSMLFSFSSPITRVYCCTSVSSRFSNSAGLPYPCFLNLLVLSIRFCTVLLLVGYSVSHLASTLSTLLSCLSIWTNLRFCSSIHSRLFIIMICSVFSTNLCHCIISNIMWLVRLKLVVF